MSRTPCGTAFRRRAECCPDQTRPDQTVVNAVCGSSVVQIKSIHQAVDARHRALVIAARHTPTTATMDGSLRELRGGGC